MDMVYQAVKNFLKSFVNLFVALIELITSLVNGLASVLKRISPWVSGKYTELGSGRRSSLGEAVKWGIKGKKEGVLDCQEDETELVQRLREELRGKVTSKEEYLLLCARTSDSGKGSFAIALSMLALVLAGGVVIAGGNSRMEYRIWVLLVMTAVCVAVCAAINRQRLKAAENRLIRQILEEEFKNKVWEEESVSSSEEKAKKADGAEVLEKQDKEG